MHTTNEFRLKLSHVSMQDKCHQEKKKKAKCLRYNVFKTLFYVMKEKKKKISRLAVKGVKSQRPAMNDNWCRILFRCRILCNT